jgi:hypothetical protein
MCKRMTWWKLTGETRRLANGLLCACLKMAVSAMAMVAEIVRSRGKEIAVVRSALSPHMDCSIGGRSLSS